MQARSTQAAAEKVTHMDNLVGITLSKADMVALVSGVRVAMSRDTTRPNLCGIHVSNDGEQLAFAATDGHRLHAAYVERAVKGEAPPVDSVIPSEGVEKLMAAWKPLKRHKRLTLAFDGARFLTETDADGVVAVDRMIFDAVEGFPNWRKILPERRDRPPTAVDPLLDHLGRFHALRGFIKLSSGPASQQAQHRWTLTLLHWDGSRADWTRGDGFEARAVLTGPLGFEPFGVNPKLLADALRFAVGDLRHLHFQPGDGKSPIRVASLDDARVAMVMPARL